jgi:hypothetical protein
VIFNRTISTYRVPSPIDAQGIPVEDFADGLALGRRLLDEAISCTIQETGDSYTTAEFEQRAEMETHTIYTRERLTAEIEDHVVDDEGGVYVLQVVNHDEGGRGRMFSHTARAMKTREAL